MFFFFLKQHFSDNVLMSYDMFVQQIHDSL